MKTLRFVWAAVVLSTAGLVEGFEIYHIEPLITDSLPSDQTPQIEAVFSDIHPGKVVLTIICSDLAEGEFLSDLYFNFNPVDDVNQLHFTHYSTVTTGENAFDVEGYGYFDIHVHLAKASKARYSNGRSLSYRIAGPGFDASDFAFLDSLGSVAGSYYALVRVQGPCSSSEWLGCSSIQPPQSVPEPASIVLLAFGASISRFICMRVKWSAQTRSRIKDCWG